MTGPFPRAACGCKPQHDSAAQVTQQAAGAPASDSDSGEARTVSADRFTHDVPETRESRAGRTHEANARER